MKKSCLTLAKGIVRAGKCTYKCKSAFTLAEVLITLGIIGIVAAMTLPALVGKWQEKQFKTAYKKAYSDMNEAFKEPIFNQELFRRETLFQREATIQEYGIMKEKFKVITDCYHDDISPCWAKGDGIGHGSIYPVTGNSWCFTDISGRNWCTYYFNENIYVVDTNGFKGPNRFGKDRWIFTFVDKNYKRTNIAYEYTAIGPLVNADRTQASQGWCNYPPCYYQSWLLD